LVVNTSLIHATILEAGNLIINRTGNGDLTVHASVRNGSATITNPGGAIELADVQLAHQCRRQRPRCHCRR
jgi:hypothetical protein